MKRKQCGEEDQKEGGFCPNCGGEAQKAKGFRNFAWVTLALVAGTIFVSKFISKPPVSEEANMVYYIKENTLYCRDLNQLGRKNVEAQVVTEDFTKDESLDSLYQNLGYADSVGIFSVGITAPYGDGFVYPEKVTEGKYEDFSYTLRYQNGDQSDSQRISSKIFYMEIIEPNIIFYQKENDSAYIYRDGKNEKMSSSLGEIHFSKDKSAAYWTEWVNIDQDTAQYRQDLYYINFASGEKSKKVMENIEIESISEDLSSLVLLEAEKNIYRIKDQGEPEFILGEVDEVLTSNEAGTGIYYLKNTKILSALDFVEDDREQIQETEESPAEGEEADLTQLLEDLKNETVRYSKSELYYFKDGKEILIDDNYNGGPSYLEKAKGDAPPCISYYNRPGLGDKKWKLSTLRNSYDIYYYIEAEYDDKYQQLFLLGEERYAMTGNVPLITHNARESKYYYIHTEEDNYYDSYYRYYSIPIPGELRTISYAPESFGETEVVDTSVSAIYENTVGKQLYAKYVAGADYGPYLYDLYIDGEMIASKVFKPTVAEDHEKPILYFIANGDMDTGLGSMTEWNGDEGKSKTIAENVYGYNLGDAEDILMMVDYDLDDLSGSLKHYNGKEVLDVEEDVIALIGEPDTSVTIGLWQQ